jgi:hypothetical protein
MEFIRIKVNLCYCRLINYHPINLSAVFPIKSDCTSALCIEPAHVKSLIRRATCRNALGKHRAALLDLTTASDLEPSKYD